MQISIIFTEDVSYFIFSTSFLQIFEAWVILDIDFLKETGDFLPKLSWRNNLTFFYLARNILPYGYLTTTYWKIPVMRKRNCFTAWSSIIIVFWSSNWRVVFISLTFFWSESLSICWLLWNSGWASISQETVLNYLDLCYPLLKLIIKNLVFFKFSNNSTKNPFLIILIQIRKSKFKDPPAILICRLLLWEWLVCLLFFMFTKVTFDLF